MDAMLEIEKRKREAKEKKIYEKARNVLHYLGSHKRRQISHDSSKHDYTYRDDKLLIRSEEFLESNDKKTTDNCDLKVLTSKRTDGNTVSTPVFRAKYSYRSSSHGKLEGCEILGYIPGEWEMHLEKLCVRVQDKSKTDSEEAKKNALREQKKAFGLPTDDT